MFSRKIKEVSPLSEADSMFSLLERVKAAITAFYKTQEKLKLINKEIEAGVILREEEVVRLQLEVSTLLDQVDRNSKVVSNIDKILEE